MKEGYNTFNVTDNGFEMINKKSTQPTEPKWWENDLSEMLINWEGNSNPIMGAMRVSSRFEKLKTLISKVESDTIERCVGEIRSCYEYESSMAGTKFKAYSGSSGTFNSGIDTAITKLKEMK